MRSNSTLDTKLHHFRYTHGEDIPNWRVWESMYESHTLCCSVNGPQKVIGQKLMEDHFHALYDQVNAVCSKTLHMGRRQGQQELADAGVSTETIKRCVGVCELDLLNTACRSHERNIPSTPISPYAVTQRWCKYIYDEQSLSYIMDIPLDPMLQRSGFDHKHRHKMWAAHLSVDVSQLVGMLLPKLVQYEQEVALAFVQCGSFSEAQEQH